MKKRLDDIDFTIGVAISFVVFGHLLIPEFKNFQIYSALRDLIYNFHMPLFMFFSGFIMAYSYRPLTSFSKYLLFLRKKALKFFPPYILFAVLFITAENLLMEWNWDRIGEDVLKAFLMPPKSSAGYLWYIYILFQFYVIIPIILKLLNGRVWLMTVLSFIIHFSPAITEYFSLNLTGYYFLFISLGFLANKYIGVFIIDYYPL